MNTNQLLRHPAAEWCLWDTDSNNMLAESPTYEIAMWVLYEIDLLNPGWVKNDIVMYHIDGRRNAFLSSEEVYARMRQLFHDGIERMWSEFEEDKTKEGRDSEAQASQEKEGEASGQSISG